MEKNKVICVVAGRSGGHIIPGIIYVKNFTQTHPNYSVLLFSTDTQLDRSIIALYPYVFSYVPLTLRGVPGKKVWLYPLFFWEFVKAFFKSMGYLRAQRPERVVSMGGYISLPVSLAAWMLRIPVELFELNAVPGKAIRWLAPLAGKIYICFDEAKGYFKREKNMLTDYPLRFTAEDRVTQASGRIHLGLDQSKKTVLILGGSQGSKSINDLMIAVFKDRPDIASNIQVIHQAGASQEKPLEHFYEKHNIRALVFDYMHDLHYCYAAADLVIARAGAGTLFELLFFSKRAILIPLEIAMTDHQLDNAKALVRQRPDLFSLIRQGEIASHKRFYEMLQS